MFIICELWCKGFYIPPLGTIFIDKLMRKHNLMQDIGLIAIGGNESDYGDNGFCHWTW